MSHAMPPDSGRSSGERSSLSVRSLNGEPQTPDEIEAEIEVQREQLAETIDSLSAKLDVKSQAQAKVDEVKRTAQGKVAHVNHVADDAKARGVDGREWANAVVAVLGGKVSLYYKFLRGYVLMGCGLCRRVERSTVPRALG